MRRKYPLQNARILAVCIACLAVLWGCNSAQDARVNVAGEVLVDGQSLQDGSISLVPTAGLQAHSVGGPVVKGKFNLQGLMPGSYVVEVNAVQLTGRQVRDLEFDVLTDEVVPIEFEESHTVELRIGGENYFVLQMDSR